VKKPDSYRQVYHCKDCEFCWCLGYCQNVCTIGMIEHLPLHPHNAWNFKTDKALHEYDMAVRTFLKNNPEADVLVDFYSGTCDAIIVRGSPYG